MAGCAVLADDGARLLWIGYLGTSWKGRQDRHHSTRDSELIAPHPFETASIISPPFGQAVLYCQTEGLCMQFLKLASLVLFAGALMAAGSASGLLEAARDG